MRLIVFVFVFFSGAVLAQDGSYSVYLVGDAGEDTTSGHALLMLKRQLDKDPRSAVIFLGDNVYPSGFSNNSPKSRLHLESQLNILKKYKGRVYFIPGNHDWDAQRRRGLDKVKQQKMHIDNYLQNNSAVVNKEDGCFFPAEGLPGPVSVMLNEKLRLIMIDTQWFLHFHKKNKIGSKKQTVKIFYERLDSLLRLSSGNGEQVIIAAHHPVYTNGSHARRMQPWRFMVNCTPFKILGFCGLDRLFSQDIYQPGYRRMRSRLLASMKEYNNIIYASGHDHNTQCFKEEGKRFIVSGNGSKVTKLRKKKRFDSVFQDDQLTGFVKLEFSEDKKITTKIYRVGMDVKLLEAY
ncbi:MAG TPA: metallophosphoesterase [Bacteroidia bacterium]|jgi:calcineurin-like phosphoesterase family protein